MFETKHKSFDMESVLRKRRDLNIRSVVWEAGIKGMDK